MPSIADSLRNVGYLQDTGQNFKEFADKLDQDRQQQHFNEALGIAFDKLTDTLISSPGETTPKVGSGTALQQFMPQQTQDPTKTPTAQTSGLGGITKGLGGLQQPGTTTGPETSRKMTSQEYQMKSAGVKAEILKQLTASGKYSSQQIQQAMDMIDLKSQSTMPPAPQITYKEIPQGGTLAKFDQYGNQVGEIKGTPKPKKNEADYEKDNKGQDIVHTDPGTKDRYKVRIIKHDDGTTEKKNEYVPKDQKISIGGTQAAKEQKSFKKQTEKWENGLKSDRKTRDALHNQLDQNTLKSLPVESYTPQAINERNNTMQAQIYDDMNEEGAGLIDKFYDHIKQMKGEDKLEEYLTGSQKEASSMFEKYLSVGKKEGDISGTTERALRTWAFYRFGYEK